MRDETWAGGVYMAEFESADQLIHAANAFERKGYTLLEIYSPVPVTTALKEHRSLLPVAVFLIGLLGGIASYLIEWWANAHAYPLDVGGRPAHAVPAFFVPTFEGTVLSASLAAFIGFFVITRLPQPWHPVFEIDGFERTTVDRYWLAVDARDHRSAPDLTPVELFEFGPLRVVTLDPQP